MRRRIISSIVSFALSISALTAISVITAAPAQALTTGTGSGLFALFKNEAVAYSTPPADIKFSERCGSAILTTLDFNWNSSNMPTGSSCGTLSSGVYTNFKTMITGYILAPITGTVTFKVRSDDGFYMNVNGTNVLSTWAGHAASPAGSYDATGTMSMVEGNIYPVKAFFNNGTAGTELYLYWNIGSGDVIIPQSNLGLTASDLGTGCAVGESQYCPADNARQIKAINGTNTNGKYWINVGGVSTNTYSLMDSNIDGGAWMLAMKGLTNSQGNSTGLGYDATQWTTSALLQSGTDKNAPLKTNQGQTCSSGNGVTCVSGDDANAKNDVFNYSAATEALVVWPDLTARSDGYRYTGASTYGFTWKESLTSSSTFVNNVTNGYNSSYGCPSTAVTLLNLFSNALRCKVRNANSTSPYDARGATVFSYQNDVNFYGFNYRGVGDVKKARFGFGWNENGGAQENSNDVVGGIGIGGSYNPTYGAGDYIGCCATSNGINRQAGFEFYVRNSSLGVSGSTTATATYGTASTPWTASSPGYSSGALLQSYIVKPIGSGVDMSKISINASTGAVSVTSEVAGGTYNLSVSLIDTYGQVASTKFTLTVKDAGLTALALTTGTLSPVFDKATFAYTATVPYGTTSISVTPTGALASSSYQTNVNSAGYSSALWTGTQSVSLALNYGSNTIAILVTATDGVTTKTYTLTVTREGPPAAPTSLSPTAGNAQATITFTAGALNGNAVTNYKYSTDGINYTAFSPAVTSSPVVVTGLTNGTPYSIYLKAVSAAGDSAASTSVSVTPKTSPSAPTGLSATVGNGQLTISFTEGATGGSAITNYKYSIDGSTFTALSPVDASSPVTIPSLTNGTSYTVYLKAVNVVGDGEASASVTATPNIVPTVSSVPTISGTPTRGQQLTASTGSWANNAASYTYTWSRATTAAGTYTTISGAITNTYTLVTADIGNFIKVSVTASNSAGSSTAALSAATAAAVAATDPVILLDSGNSSSYSGSGSTWNDIGGNGFSAGLINSPTFSSSNSGIINFSAASKQYATSNTALPALTNFTSEAWFKLTSWPTGQGASIFSTTYSGSGKVGPTMWVSSTGKLNAGFFSGGAWRTAYNTDYTSDTGEQLQLNTWYHSAVSWDGSKVRMYVNKTLVSTGNTLTGVTLAESQVLRLGVRWDTESSSGSFITGSIPIVKIYSSVLNATQISADYDTYAARYLAPAIDVSPVMTGTMTVGQTLSVTDGTWNNVPSGYTYVWARAATSGGTYTSISGATSSTYVLQSADAGYFVRATVTATNSAGSTDASATPSVLTAGALSPVFGTPTPTADGFTVQIINYSANYQWAGTATPSGIVAISGSGLVTVTGVAPGTSTTATITSTRTNYTGGTGTISGTSITGAALNPTFGPVTATADGFTVSITNYSGSYSWSGLATSSGSVAINGSGLITVTGVAPGTSSTATITNTRVGYSGGSGTISGTSISGTALNPSFSSTNSTSDGFTVTITNYDAAFTWALPTVSAGSVSVTSTSGSNRVLTVTGLSAGTSATITQTNSRTGYSNGSATVTGSSISACSAASTTSSGYAIYAFASTGICNWTVPSNLPTVEVIVVAGGAGGGYSYDNTGAGGGAGGQVKIATGVTLSGIIEVNVGAGGAGGTSTSTRGASGSNSSISTVTALGGTGGCAARSACSTASQATSSAAANGGSGGSSGSAGKGGGGSNTSASAPTGTAGGSGTSSNYSGSSVTYGTGGAGGTAQGAGSNIVGSAGSTNTGNGGGGASAKNSSGNVNGGAGGTGVVIVRYLLPTITSVTSSLADGSYTVGQVVSIAMEFSTSVTVTGTPLLRLETGTNDRTASYASGTGTSSLIFTYTVQAGDTSSDLQYVGLTSLELNGGTINDATGNAVTLTLPALASASSLGGSKAIIIDTAVPVKSSATVSSTGTTLTIAYGENLSSTTAVTSQFSITGASSRSIPVSSIAISSGNVVLTLSKRVLSGEVVNFQYTDPTSGDDTNAVQDLAGNDAVSLSLSTTLSTITNSSTITAPTIATPSIGLTAIAMTLYNLPIAGALGGVGPYTYEITTGLSDLTSAGLSFNTTNLSALKITGTPTAAKSAFAVVITVTDSNGVEKATGSFNIRVNSGTQLPVSIATVYGTGGQPLSLVARGGSGTGAISYTVRNGANTNCSISGTSLTATTSAGVSGICYVTAQKAADTAFSLSSSLETTIFFTAYVPVITQTMTCPAGTVPSNPTGIGVGTCMQVLAPVSTNAGDSGAAPKITALSVATGIVTTSVVITGTGFATVTKVQFGSKSTTNFTVGGGNTTITVAVPTGATTGRVMVFSPTGTAMASQIFTVIQPDTRAPAFLSGNVNTSIATQLTLNFDESLAASGIPAAAFGVSIAGATRVVNSVLILGTTVTLTLASAVTTGQAVVFTYTSPNDSTSLQDATGNKTATITATALANTL